MRRLSTFLLLFPLTLSPQQVGQNAATPAQPSFSSTTQLVIETVTVTDKGGKPVTGLTAKDFSITEDGVPQTIRFFEFQKLDAAPAAAAMPASQRVPAFPKLTRTQIAPESPGDLRYRDRRLLALYFDLTAMPVPDQLRAFNAAKQFVRTQMSDADLLALMAFTSGRATLGW
ncbi:MAG: VWA domain-containing protein [Candidatus Solibacter usitatus]|nr:VWA domain-containing protein [Candidatus Solibacter usitatus]